VSKRSEKIQQAHQNKNEIEIESTSGKNTHRIKNHEIIKSIKIQNSDKMSTFNSDNDSNLLI
jgi:hypothetical protein